MISLVNLWYSWLYIDAISLAFVLYKSKDIGVFELLLQRQAYTTKSALSHFNSGSRWSVVFLGVTLRLLLLISATWIAQRHIGIEIPLLSALSLSRDCLCWTVEILLGLRPQDSGVWENSLSIMMSVEVFRLFNWGQPFSLRDDKVVAEFSCIL